MNDTGKPAVVAYRTSNGKEPFTEWLDSIRDKRTQNRIKKRMDRVEDGNMGDINIWALIFMNYVLILALVTVSIIVL